MADKLSKAKEGVNKKYGALSVLNQIMSRFIEWCTNRYEDVYVIKGYDTMQYRTGYGLEKDHDLDAYTIAAATLGVSKADADMPRCYEIRQFRRHDRAKIKAQVFRSYYHKGKKVAQNRRPAYSAELCADGKIKEKKQKFPALSDWFQKMVTEHGQKEAERMRSALTVKKSYRRYNDVERTLPGTIFYHNGKRYVKKGQLTNGAYLTAFGEEVKRFPASECAIFFNTGLVFIR